MIWQGILYVYMCILERFSSKTFTLTFKLHHMKSVIILLTFLTSLLFYSTFNCQFFILHLNMVIPTVVALASTLFWWNHLLLVSVKGRTAVSCQQATHPAPGCLPVWLVFKRSIEAVPRSTREDYYQDKVRKCIQSTSTWHVLNNVTYYGQFIVHLGHFAFGEKSVCWCLFMHGSRHCRPMKSKSGWCDNDLTHVGYNISIKEYKIPINFATFFFLLV